MILVLDTTDPQTLRFGISINGLRIKKSEAHHPKKDERLDATALLLRFLKKHTTGNDLSGVIVRDAAGTFSGVRLGILLTNALALSENIPVTAVKISGTPSLTQLLHKGAVVLKRSTAGVYLIPRYHKAPNISKSKVRRMPQRIRHQR
ncbi:MAG: hypothetical protein WCV86_02875 [Patescibacteria group bacterium]|jgi:tRNA A37 threonylcarbamoyladenosine modification protein TsaB